MSDPKVPIQTIDCTGGPVSLAILHMIAGCINSDGQVIIANCSGMDMQRLGFYLMADYEKAREAVGLEARK